MLTRSNERLFEKQLAQDPDDIYGRYKYGDFLRRLPASGLLPDDAAQPHVIFHRIMSRSDGFHPIRWSTTAIG
jgi:hypothetical protein